MNDATIHFHGNDGDVVIPICKFVMWTTSKLVKIMIQGNDGDSEGEGDDAGILQVDVSGRVIIPIVSTAFACSDFQEAVRFLHEQKSNAADVVLKSSALPVLVYLRCMDAPRVHALAKFRVADLSRIHGFLLEKLSTGCVNIWSDAAGATMHPLMEFLSGMDPLEWMPLMRKKLVTDETIQILCVLLFYTRPTVQHLERMYLIIQHILTTDNVQYRRLFPLLLRFFISVGCRATSAHLPPEEEPKSDPWHRPFKDIIGRLLPVEFFSSGPKPVDVGCHIKTAEYLKGIFTTECGGGIRWYLATIPMPHSTSRVERVDIDRAPLSVDIKVQNHRHLEERTISVSVKMVDVYRQPGEDVFVWVWSNVEGHGRNCYRKKLGETTTPKKSQVCQDHSFSPIPSIRPLLGKQVFVAIVTMPSNNLYIDYHIPVCARE